MKGVQRRRMILKRQCHRRCWPHYLAVQPEWEKADYLNPKWRISSYVNRQRNNGGTHFIIHQVQYYLIDEPGLRHLGQDILRYDLDHNFPDDEPEYAASSQ